MPCSLESMLLPDEALRTRFQHIVSEWERGKASGSDKAPSYSPADAVARLELLRNPVAGKKWTGIRIHVSEQYWSRTPLVKLERSKISISRCFSTANALLVSFADMSKHKRHDVSGMIYVRLC